MSKENKNANEMDSVDQHLEEISKMYDKVTIWQRLKILSVGLRSPRSTKEYKEAMIELQRLSAPAAAVNQPNFSAACRPKGHFFLPISCQSGGIEPYASGRAAQWRAALHTIHRERANPGCGVNG